MREAFVDIKQERNHDGGSVSRGIGEGEGLTESENLYGDPARSY